MVGPVIYCTFLLLFKGHMAVVLAVVPKYMHERVCACLGFGKLT